MVADRYEVGALVGTGSIATVHRGYDRLLQRPVAVRLFPSGTSARTRAPLDREVAAVTQLHHPGLAVLYDAGTEGDRAYLVTQFVDGPSLAARLRRGPLALRAVAPLGAHLSAALAYVHARGVAHGDVRPGNVVLGPEGRPMLTDLGLAELVDLSGLTIGRGALAEERGPAADVRGLGVTLRAALTGPSGDEGPGPVPDELDALLVRMTADDPAARPPAAEVNDALRHGGSTASRRSGWGPGWGSPVVPVGPGAADDALLDPALLTGAASAPERAPAALRRRAALTVAAGALVVGAVAGGAAGVGETLHLWAGPGQADGTSSFASVDTTPVRSGFPGVGAPMVVVPGTPVTPPDAPSPAGTPGPVPDPRSGAGGLRAAGRAGDGAAGATSAGAARRGAPATAEAREQTTSDSGDDPGGRAVDDRGGRAGDEGRSAGGDHDGGASHDDGRDEGRDDGHESGGESGGDSGGHDGGHDESGGPDDGASSESGSDLGDAASSVI
ncbi:serine/threonine-protein kinase [Actinomycetospora sp. NBC_00405]|uniref:serine/threonine-protein kinase n=1 Tax=Actinomycetospora sp. NBC_00405 TaxID=2975952 RepID=UPI002E1D3E4B